MAPVKRTSTQAHSSVFDESQSLTDSDAVTVKEVKDKVKTAKERRPFYMLGRFVFPLGLFCTILAYTFLEPNDVREIHAHMSVLMEQYSVNFSALPAFDLPRFEEEWSRFRSSIPEIWKFNNDGREFMVGEAMKSRGLKAQHPVVLIPGIISTSLESWSTLPAYRALFREKLWGGFNMVSQVALNKQRWIAAMRLDPVSGLDPSGVKVRASEGIDAANTFMHGYWIWSKIVENLAVVNYDTNNLYLAPYDWRLSYYNLEERDGYFSKLKTTIEGLKRRQQKKVVIVTHSMGSTVLLYFFKWVESPLHGAGGHNWVEDHVEAYVAIAGTHLGVAKAMAAFLSGEMKDTVQMNPAGAYVLERFFSRRERQDLFRSWAGSASMWIKGGNAVWGNHTTAPDDELGTMFTHGELISFRQPETVASSKDSSVLNMTADEAGTWILEQTPSTFQKMLATNYSFGIERDEDALEQNNLDHTKWSNPLEVRLPQAPSMKIYCVYGHGKETERSYWYARGKQRNNDVSKDDLDHVCRDPTSEECVDSRVTPGFTPPKQVWVDANFTSDTILPKIRNGVKMGEGDGTVSLLSLGAMCVEGWKRPRWNPAGIKITTVELPHQPISAIPRGGANTSDHVDILGSTGVNEIVIKVAAGVGHEIKDSYVSNIREYAQKIKWD